MTLVTTLMATAEQLQQQIGHVPAAPRRAVHPRQPQRLAGQPLHLRVEVASHSRSSSSRLLPDMPTRGRGPEQAWIVPLAGTGRDPAHRPPVHGAVTGKLA